MSKLLVCKVDKHLRIGKDKSSFPNKEELNYYFKAGVPLEVEDYVAKAYSESYPHIYTVVETSEPVKTEEPKKEEPKEAAFDALQFLTQNPKIEEEQLKALKQSELLAICEVLDLKAHPNTGVAKLAAMIAQEVAVQNSEE